MRGKRLRGVLAGHDQLSPELAPRVLDGGEASLPLVRPVVAPYDEVTERSERRKARRVDQLERAFGPMRVPAGRLDERERQSILDRLLIPALAASHHPEPPPALALAGLVVPVLCVGADQVIEMEHLREERRQRVGCDGERLNRDKLETAVLDQLARLYRDGDLIAAALHRARDDHAADRPALEEQRRAVAEEIRRDERALDRYYQAFENGDLEPAQFKTRLANLEHKRETLAEQEQELTAQIADPAESLDPTALAAVADRLRDTLAKTPPEQAKALLRLLIKELRVNGRSEILPTYRVVAPEVCATTSSVDPTWRCTNHTLVVAQAIDMRYSQNLII